MEHLVAIVVGAAAIFVLGWLLWPKSSSPAPEETSVTEQSELIDPSDAGQIGLLIGLAGGTIPDAATARFALQRFEEIHGRKATTRDVGVVAGLVTTVK